MCLDYGLNFMCAISKGDNLLKIRPQQLSWIQTIGLVLALILTLDKLLLLSHYFLIPNRDKEYLTELQNREYDL